MSEIRLIAGLGNPGREYESTRHNAGCWWVDELARSYGLTFKSEAKFNGSVARGMVGAQEVWLLKPQTYMNHSGRSVAALAQFYKIEPAQLLVAHDELDLPPGAVKLKMGGGHGGHNGLKDITSHIGPGYWRLRIGIGHPGDRSAVSGFVLNAPRREELELITDGLSRAQDVARLIIEGKQEAAMLKLHSA